MADMKTLAGDTATRLVVISDRAGSVARGVALLTTASVGLAYLVGLLVFPSPARWIWAAVGLVVCAIPPWCVWTAFRRLRRIPQTFATTVTELQSLVGDREVRDALYELVDRDPDHEQRAPLLTLGKDLVRLRNAVGPRRATLVDLWQNVTAITALPGLMAIGVVGSFAALIFSVVVVLVGLAI